MNHIYLKIGELHKIIEERKTKILQLKYIKENIKKIHININKILNQLDELYFTKLNCSTSRELQKKINSRKIYDILKLIENYFLVTHTKLPLLTTVEEHEKAHNKQLKVASKLEEFFFEVKEEKQFTETLFTKHSTLESSLLESNEFLAQLSVKIEKAKLDFYSEDFNVIINNAHKLLNFIVFNEPKKNVRANSLPPIFSVAKAFDQPESGFYLENQQLVDEKQLFQLVIENENIKNYQLYLLVYRYFSNAEALFSELFSYFPAISDDYQLKKYLISRRNKCLKFLMYWIINFFTIDFLPSPSLIDACRSFLVNIVPHHGFSSLFFI